MNFYDFWKDLGDEEKAEFAMNAGISENYISTHLIYRYKTPRLHKLKSMALASKGRLDFSDLCEFFSQQPEPV